MFHHSHFDTLRSSRQRSAKSGDRLEADVDMMTQIHVHLKTFENITCVDSDYPLKKTALANSEETSDVGADNSVTLEGKEKGGLKAKRSWLVRVESRRYASNFCKAAQTS